jgi:hypothetical protein
MLLGLFALLWWASGADGQRLGIGELPLISVGPSRNGMREIEVGMKRTPDVFQYRITQTREAALQYPPWIEDRLTDAIMARGVTCADLLRNRKILFRDKEGVVRETPLEPVPLEQIWGPDRVRITTDRPGIQRNRVSACCNAETCLDRCLVFPRGEPWFLEINAPQLSASMSVTLQLSWLGLPDKEEMRVQYGIWPVMRIPCHYCPFASCISNCSNGEYATEFTDLSVSRFPRVFVFIGRKPDPRSRQTGIQVNRVECKPCAPGTWNTCKEKANCRWFIPQGLDNTLGEDIHVFPGGPGQASFFYLESSSRRARDARLFRVQCGPATPARR